MTGERDAALDAWLDDHGDDLVALRRDLHRHPELSGEEHRTTDVLVERLARAGLHPRRLRRGTGLLCDVGGGDGPVVALRADLDALAMQDEKETEPRSQRDGVAHACGHDVHTAVVLGAGLHLATRWPADGPRLRLVFQPAEEALPGGALDAIADGALDDVVAVYGLHCEPKQPTGTVGLRTGAITSATDSLTITLRGPGGHTARPELTVDLVHLAARVVTELPARVRAAVGETPFKLVFGAVHAGAAPNVIPASAELRAVIRTPSADLWTALPEVVEAELAALVTDERAAVEVTHTRGVPPVVNDPGAVEAAEIAVRRRLGGDAVVAAPQSWGGDDFAWYTQQVPGAYLRLGTHDPDDDGPMLDLHAGHFDVDERAIAIGVRVLVAVVEEQRRRLG
ncbi:MAG: amidohydrolase [Acidimicrobiia bacterium]